MNIKLEILTIILSIAALGLGVASLWVSILANRKTNRYKEIELDYKGKEYSDKQFERKISNKSRLKPFGGGSDFNGQELKFKNMDNMIKMVRIDFEVDNGLNIKKLNTDLYKMKIIEIGEIISLYIPRDGYQKNMDEIHCNITFYYTDMIKIPYKQRFVRQNTIITFDEEPIEVRDYEKAYKFFI